MKLKNGRHGLNDCQMWMLSEALMLTSSSKFKVDCSVASRPVPVAGWSYCIISMICKPIRCEDISNAL